MPNKGAKVTYTGKWQPCDIGKSYNLTATGGWQINNDDPNRHLDCLNVGLNGYSESVNIVVGILNEDTGAWQAFFVNPDKLPPNGFAQYKPRDNIQIWFAEGIVTETIISTQSTKVENFDMTGIPLQYFWFDTETGSWLNQDKTFDLPK
ncbi:hypothetical protein A9K55_003443 [Cordyceps militaris]|uniref:Uncharacterized protein n=1 Tax=Cordyceps militaris TaxID=73501 RepID=A0A2H4S9B6_CORMI|nr:hypothetical protein A9K55_003443 [Cordyceps militaris]